MFITKLLNSNTRDGSTFMIISSFEDLVWGSYCPSMYYDRKSVYGVQEDKKTHLLKNARSSGFTGWLGGFRVIIWNDFFSELKQID